MNASKMRKLFRHTMNKNDYKDVELSKIEENKSHRLVYDAIINGKSNNNNNNNINNKGNNERTLFHGTSKDSIDKIINNGFNRDFNVTHRYGKGVYFARDASESYNYCKRSSDGYYYMLICRVFVGDYTIGSSNMTTPPLKNDNKTHYDSLVNSINNPTIFVISKDYHAIPEYIVQFK